MIVQSREGRRNTTEVGGDKEGGRGEEGGEEGRKEERRGGRRRGGEEGGGWGGGGGRRREGGREGIGKEEMGREKEGIFIPEWLLPDAQLFTTTERESVFTEDILVLWYTAISSILNQYTFSIL